MSTRHTFPLIVLPARPQLVNWGRIRSCSRELATRRSTAAVVPSFPVSSRRPVCHRGCRLSTLPRSWTPISSSLPMDICLFCWNLPGQADASPSRPKPYVQANSSMPDVFRKHLRYIDEHASVKKSFFGLKRRGTANAGATAKAGSPCQKRGLRSFRLGPSGPVAQDNEQVPRAEALCRDLAHLTDASAHRGCRGVRQ
ncbi:MAG: hypothetical protein JWO62_2031 [Acidimicrobiaceae bacterium]|nr:hypothetical protein [Acidimicrobiaceae bacterium]